jgi:hypothetical protein
LSFPAALIFPPDYRFSESAVFKAYNKAMNLRPVANAEVSRKADTTRLDHLYLQPLCH